MSLITKRITSKNCFSEDFLLVSSCVFISPSNVISDVHQRRHLFTFRFLTWFLFIKGMSVIELGFGGLFGGFVTDVTFLATIDIT